MRPVDFKRLLKDGRNEAVAAKGFLKAIVRVGSGSTVSKVFLYGKIVFPSLRRQMRTAFSQNVFLSSNNVLQHFGHYVWTLNWHTTESKVRRKAME